MDYSVIKNEVLVNATIWMNLEKNMLKEDTKGPVLYESTFRQTHRGT